MINAKHSDKTVVIAAASTPTLGIKMIFNTILSSAAAIVAFKISTSFPNKTRPADATKLPSILAGTASDKICRMVPACTYLAPARMTTAFFPTTINPTTHGTINSISTLNNFVNKPL